MIVRHRSLLLALTLAALALGCNKSDDTITSATSKYAVDGDNGEPADPTGDAIALVPPDNSPAGSFEKPPATDQGGDAPMTRPDEAEDPGASTPDAADDSAATPGSQATPDQILGRIMQLQQSQPSGETREELLANFQDSREELIALVDALMSKDVEPAIKAEAAAAKIDTLYSLSQVGLSGGRARLDKYLGDLAKDETPELSRLGNRMSLRLVLTEFSSPDPLVAQRLIDDFAVLLEEGTLDGELLRIGELLSVQLLQNGFEQEALAGQQTIIDKFGSVEDPQIAAHVASLAEQLRMHKLDLRSRAEAFVGGEPGSTEAVMEAVEILLADKPGEATLGAMQMLANAAETTDQDTAIKIYDAVEVAYAEHPIPELAEGAMRLVEGFRARSSLVGSDFVVEGVTVDGEPFDWSPYEGKVVMVDYWATWCGPCLRAMPMVKATYNKYHDAGFEIVGVSLDEEPADLQRFLSLQELPWPSVLSADPEEAGWNHPMCRKAGVAAIPFMVLVGRDGKVISAHNDVNVMHDAIAKVFGDAPDEPSEEAAENAAEEAPEKAEDAPTESEKSTDSTETTDEPAAPASETSEAPSAEAADSE